MGIGNSDKKLLPSNPQDNMQKCAGLFTKKQD
jgi:hypothetical protein